MRTVPEYNRLCVLADQRPGRQPGGAAPRAWRGDLPALPGVLRVGRVDQGRGRLRPVLQVVRAGEREAVISFVNQGLHACHLLPQMFLGIKLAQPREKLYLEQSPLLKVQFAHHF